MKTESERKVEHSPLPWSQEQCHIYANRELTERSPAVARTDLSHGMGDAGLTDEANAAFIVQACNSHDALVEACRKGERALRGLKNQCDEREWREDWQDLSETLKALEAALKLAGKEGE